jgi:hypothetical protein
VILQNKLQSRLEANVEKPWSIHEVERTGGEPDGQGFNLERELTWAAQQRRPGTQNERTKRKASRLSAFIAGDPPHGSVAILGEQQGAVMCHRYPDRPAPDAAIVGDETSHKIFILSGWNSMI